MGEGTPKAGLPAVSRYYEPSGCDPIDRLIGGGYPRKMITQIYGEPGSGKSTFCLIAAVSVLRAGKSVIYIDTESFSVDRFSQVATGEAEELSERFYLYEAADFDQQASMILDAGTILGTRNAGLIVVDSATGLYRTELEHGQDSLQRLSRQMVMLLGYAKRYDIPVLVTNQIYMDPSKNDFCPLGGTSLFHLSKVILRIEKNSTSRRIRVVKHHSRPEGEFLDFIMVQDGISLVGADSGGSASPEKP
ncbi:MAG TPA: DNA repair and recombination protein RadB [Methanospirillum sp.]|nr:DNA repair and recombination protein RadB [Methanospirillum sp.]